MKNKFFNLIITLICIVKPCLVLAANDADLIKVTTENNPNCVEYYMYRGSIYCSTKAVSSQPVDPEIKNYETQTIVFDDRAWQPAWGKKSDTITTVEYVPKGDDINNWNELVTSQFFPGLQNKVSPQEYAMGEIENMKNLGFKPVINIFKNTSDSYIFEFRIESPDNQIQDELQKITRGSNGIYILHYVIKKSDMGKKNRDLWLSNLTKSKIK